MDGTAANPIGAGHVGEVLLGLLLVVFAIFVVAWLLRRLQSGGLRGSASLRVLAVLPVGQRERIVLIDAGGTQLLLGVTASGISRLHEFEEPLLDTQAVRGGGDADFAARLRQALMPRQGS